MPIIDASCVAKSGVAIVWLSSCTRPSPMPMPNSAMRIGQPHREQRTERDEQDDDGGEDADELGRAEPARLLEHAPAERDRARRHPSASSLRLRMCSMVASEIFDAAWSNWTVAYAMSPLRATWRAPSAVYGLITEVTPGTLATSAKSFSMRACTAASCTPPCVGEDDLALVTGTGGEPRLEQLRGARRLGVGEGEPLREGGADVGADHAHRDQGDDPQHHDAPTPSVAPGRQSLQHPPSLP